MSGGESRPLLTGGLRGPAGLLITAALCPRLLLIIDCSNTPFSTGSSVLCKNSRTIGRSTFPSKSEEVSYRPAVESNASQVNTLCNELAETPLQHTKASSSSPDA